MVCPTGYHKRSVVVLLATLITLLIEVEHLICAFDSSFRLMKLLQPVATMKTDKKD